MPEASVFIISNPILKPLNLEQNMKLLGKMSALTLSFCFISGCAVDAQAVVAFRMTDSSIKESVVQSIQNYCQNVTFAILFDSKKLTFSRQNHILPQFWRFGLVAAESMIDSRWADGIPIPSLDQNLLFCYESDRHSKLDMNDDTINYCGSASFSLGMCRIFFMTPQRSIIESRYDAIELIPGGRVSTSLTKFLSKDSNRDYYAGAFSNRVFKTCDGGAFSVDYKCAEKALKDKLSLSEDEGQLCAIAKREWDSQLYLGDVVLGGREISEIVYWLWKRDGKVGKYPELCKRHPELFEPISGLDDFKTEIGRMLVERSKQ